MTVDLADLATAAGAAFHKIRVSGLDTGASTVICEDGPRLDYTHLSLNTRAVAPSLADTAKNGVLSIKPALAFVEDLCTWEEGAPPDAPVGVIGGGVPGIELAFALAYR